MSFPNQRITILCGHYGSGKTNVALHLAHLLHERGSSVSVADLDIVNPYFRTKDFEPEFKEMGIRLICSEFANSNVDLPSMPADLYTITDDRSRRVIIDVGGDDRGALALGRIRDGIRAENDYEMLGVLNCYRPLTRDVDSAVEVLREIEAAAGMRLTGLINNSNLGLITTTEDVRASYPFANGVAEAMNLPLVATACLDTLYDELKRDTDSLLPLHIKSLWKS